MAKVKTFIEGITGQEEERKKAKDEVNQMVTLAMAKLDAMELKLREKFRNKELEGQLEIVGDRLGAFSREYRVNYSDGNMSKAVDELIGSIMGLGEGDTRNLIARIVSNALNAMFSSITSIEEEKQIFVVTLEGAALVRYDFDVWRSAEADASVSKHCQSVVAITYARSVVDHTKVSEDKMNDAINCFLGGSASLDDVIEYKKKLIELLKLHINENSLSSCSGKEIIPLMSGIPVDTEKAEDFANTIKMTDESRYVEEFLKSFV